MSRWIKFIGYFGLLLSLLAVEERNPFPFYYLNTKPIKLIINPKKVRLCRIKLQSIVEIKNVEILDCYEFGKKLSDSIKLIHEKNDKKNELNLIFVDENKQMITPELQTSEMIYKVNSILFFKKTKLHQIELIDKNGGYYYFIYDPVHVGIGE
ncbi:MAG: hypothetical protein IPL26_08900 [Leptospiraceae bacterium]|nr:hypothetical protein [Leptospiraceae bacterium]